MNILFKDVTSISNFTAPDNSIGECDDLNFQKLIVALFEAQFCDFIERDWKNLGKI